MNDFRTFIDECLDIFKGEISYNEMMKMPYYELQNVYKTRVNKLIERRKEEEKLARQREQERARQSILRK